MDGRRIIIIGIIGNVSLIRRDIARPCEYIRGELEKTL
jgi:hypothetical protein